MGRQLIPNLRIPWLTLAFAASFIFVFYGVPHNTRPLLSDLLAQGASSAQIIADGGGWWRLFTANWIHESPMHLWGNIFLLLNIGLLAELFFYRLDLILIYLLGGVAAMALALCGGPAVVTYGCSGMLFSALWATVIISYRYRRYLKPAYKRFLLWALPVYAVIILAAGFMMPGVSGLAHLGGLLAGWIMGRVFIVRHPVGLVPYRWLKIGAVFVICVLCAFFAHSRRTVPYLFVGSDFGAVFKAPSGWKIHGQKLPAGDSFMLENGLGAVILLDSELTGDGASDELLRTTETQEQLAEGQFWLRETTLNKGFYRYHLAFSCPVSLVKIYDGWWMRAVESLTVDEPHRLKDARRRAEAPARSLYDYLAFAEELFLFGEYGEGQRLLNQLLETFGQKPSILEKIQRWQDYSTLGDTKGEG